MADSPALEVTDRTGRCLRATFAWQRDRYSHRIDVLERGSTTTCLTSDEGGDRDQWPLSPPLQQSSMETAAHGRNIALLVGMAGKSHWSVSVECDPATTSLVFDVACRVGRQPRWLGTTYRANSPITIDSQDADRVMICDRAAMFSVDSVDAAPGAAVKREGDCISVVAPLLDASPPFTVRWKYRIGLLG